MRWVIARVFPVPAPASTRTGPCRASATSRCSGSRPSSSRSAPASVAGGMARALLGTGRDACVGGASGTGVSLVAGTPGSGVGATPGDGGPAGTNAAAVVFDGHRARPRTGAQSLDAERTAQDEPALRDDVLDPVVWLLPPAP